MSEAERYVVRAAWQVLRDMGFALPVATEFRERLEAQVTTWRREDAEQQEGWAV